MPLYARGMFLQGVPIQHRPWPPFHLREFRRLALHHQFILAAFVGDDYVFATIGCLQRIEELRPELRCWKLHRTSVNQLYSRTLRNRSAFPMTETELKLMAAAAIMGLKSRPKDGYRTPAAMGTPNAL